MCQFVYLEVEYGNNAKILNRATLCMTTTQGENNEFLHYNVHPLYGLTHTIATQK